MTSTDPRTVAAREILEVVGTAGAAAVSKPVRAGLTTSTVLAAKATGKRLLVVAPTLRILRETVSEAAGGGAVMVAGNGSCPLLAEELAAYPLLEELPIALPDDCEKCPHFGACEVTAILGRPDFDAAGVTYAKIQALMLSGSKISKMLRAAVQKTDYVLLDEAHLLGFGSVPSVPVAPLPEAPDGFKSLERVRGLWIDLLARHGETVGEIEEGAREGPAGKHLSRHIDIPDPLSWRDLRVAWSELRKLAKAGEMGRDELLLLRDAIEILSYGRGSLHYVSEDEGRHGHIQISGSRGKGERAIWEFLHNVIPFSGHVYASGTLIEPHEGYFAELSGKAVSRAIFPDVLRASERVTLIPDCWSLNAGGFAAKLPAIIDQIRQIAEREREPIYCLCPNVAKAGVLRKKLKEAGVAGVLVDYYRSDKSIGVARPERIAVCIGMAEIPANALDPLARGRDEDERWIDSRRLRRLAVHAATWQALNRVRDPGGVTPSRVYMVGVPLDEVRELSRWGPGRAAVLEEVRTTTRPDGSTGRKPIFSIRVDEEVERCNILGVDMKRGHSEKRRACELVEKIELYDENSIKRENHSFFPILYNREKGVKYTFYNFPSNKSEFESNATSLYNLFVSRDDTYGQQLSKGGYDRIIGYLRFDALMDHVEGRKTAGCYQINPDDYVLWGCFDVDSHEAGDDGTVSREKVSSLVDVLEVYGIPYMLEASGSLGSYHLWVLFKRTATYNAFRFMRQVAREAKVKDIEIFPKQKKISSDRYGNLVKLPMGINQKNGARSAFLDAGTFEPLEGLILVPGRVCLLEIPELTGDAKAMPKARRVPAEGPGSAPGGLDHCMVQALAAGVDLSETPGHLLRVAIATKAAFIGMSPEETAELFSSLPGFDRELSRAKAEEIGSRGYSPWSCEKLRDSCGEFVTRWCSSCPFVAAAFRGMSSG